MKSAFLIAAHKNPNQVKNLAYFLSQDGDGVFIHVNKRNNDVYNQLVSTIGNNKNIHIITDRVKIYWGGVGLVLASLNLLQTANNTDHFDYFHFITGQCVPLKTPKQINMFFEENNVKEFIDNFSLPNKTWGPEDGGLDRLQYYWINGASVFVRSINKTFRIIQKKLHLKRKMVGTFYGGCGWFSLSNNCVNYILTYLKNNPDFKKRFNHTGIPDEIFYQTVVMNSPFAAHVINDSLRYLNWKSENTRHPQTIRFEDVPKIFENKKNIFARKFDENSDIEALQAIYKNNNFEYTK